MAFVELLFFAFLSTASASENVKSANVGIIGGHTITIEQVPFMISLRLNGTYHWCGGSIIHERFILTAAHCIIANREFKVAVGTDQIDNGGQVYDIEKIIPHEQYSSKTQDNDICLIKLTKPIVFGPTVAKIELADETLKLRKKNILAITGWGNTTPTGHVAKHLLQVDIPVVSRPVCQRIYFGLRRQLTPRMICAGGNGKDSCQGDSGGPLTYKNKQVGLASFGAGCGNVPGVYTKTSALLPWINDTIEKNLNSNSTNKNKKDNHGGRNKKRT